MKKQINPNIQPHLIRGAYYLLLLVATCAIPVALAQRNATKRSVAKPTTIIVVTNTNDSGSGSLRDALAMANDGDTIDATGVSGTILLISGELQINHNVTINGPGAGNLAVNGNATSRVFHNFASNVTISGFTIINGFTTDTLHGGGGILNEEGLTISDSNIVNNVGGAFGGGITSITAAPLTVTNTVISGNTSALHGGGIAICCGVTLTVTNSVITGNESSFGGGIHADDAVVTVSNSTINGNTGSNIGGGITLDGFAGLLTVTNSTISGNMAGSGGGVGTNCACDNVAGSGDGVVNFSINVTNTTFSGNSASRGGCIFIDARDISMSQIGDTILNAGASGGTILNLSVGTLTSLGYNLASDDGGGVLTGPGDQTNTNPLLGPLQDNGGPTFTHALLPGSPAIDTGDPNFTPPPFYDQRGPDFFRLRNGRIDIGSFEVQVGSTPSPTPTPTATATATPTVTATATSTATATATPTSTVAPTPRAAPTPRSRPTPAPRP